MAKAGTSAKGRTADKLTARTVATITEPGRHSDGGGLYLNVTPTGARSWLFMWKVAGKRREMGLGSARDVSLKEARDLAADCRKTVRAGADPVAARKAPRTLTFGEAADELIASMGPTWRNAKHRAQWEMTLKTYCPKLRPMKVSAVTTSDVLTAIKPLWQTKPETASRLRGRIEKVLDYAKAKGMRSGENPALWRGHLDAILPKRAKLTRGHHAAMPFADVPAFISNLRDAEGLAARALEFTILTAARSGETYGAQWNEFDFEAKVWTVPAGRMKAGRIHRIPLSDRALEILVSMKASRVSDFVFPGMRPNRPLSSMAMEMTLRRMKVDVTVHGFRSAFRDWCGEETSFPREVAEAALAHVIGDKAEQAYRRGDALEKRRALMAAWASLCNPQADKRVVPLSRARGS